MKPEFIKGYYRLATAQVNAKLYDGAEATIRQGLALENNNSQLLKILRSVKLQKKAAAATTASGARKPPADVGTDLSKSGYKRHLDTATMREIHDLQQQYGDTAREYNTVDANLYKASKEEKMYNITLSEVEKNPSLRGNYYRSVGKLFLRSSQAKIVEHLQQNIKGQQKTQKELTGKKEYLEKKLKSQKMNMKELSQRG